MRRKRNKKFKKINFQLNFRLVLGVIFLTVIAGLMVILGYAVYTLGVFQIEETEIKSDIVLDRSVKEKIKGRSLFSVDVRYIYSLLQRQNPEYKAIYIRKEFPSQVIIMAEKRSPFAQIKDKRFYPVDREGVVLGDGSAASLDNLIPIELDIRNYPLEKGSRVKDANLELAFDLIEALQKEGFFSGYSVNLINSLRPETVTFFITSRNPAGKPGDINREIKIIIPRVDFRQKIALLKDIISRELNDRISLVRYIDLSHKKVYVGFWR